jgi:hypothetical protein
MTSHRNYSASARVYSTAIIPIVTNCAVIVGANICNDNGYEVPELLILLRKLFEKAHVDSEVSGSIKASLASLLDVSIACAPTCICPTASDVQTRAVLIYVGLIAAGSVAIK